MYTKICIYHLMMQKKYYNLLLYMRCFRVYSSYKSQIVLVFCCFSGVDSTTGKSCGVNNLSSQKYVVVNLTLLQTCKLYLIGFGQLFCANLPRSVTLRLRRVNTIFRKASFLNEHKSKIYLAHPTFISVTEERLVLIEKCGSKG